MLAVVHARQLLTLDAPTPSSPSQRSTTATTTITDVLLRRGMSGQWAVSCRVSGVGCRIGRTEYRTDRSRCIIHRSSSFRFVFLAEGGGCARKEDKKAGDERERRKDIIMVILLYSAALALALSTHLLSRCLSPPSIYLSIYTFSPSSPRFCTSSFAAMTACSPPPLYLLSVFSVLQTNASIYSTLRSYFCVCSATTERERGLTVAVDTYLLSVPVTVASARASQEVFHGRSLSAEHHFIIIGLALFLELLRPAQASMYAHRGTRSSLPWVAGLSARPVLFVILDTLVE